MAAGPRAFPRVSLSARRGPPALTERASFITLRIPMSYRFRFLLLFAAACVAFPERIPAPVVFRPGAKVKYQAPGEEEISGNAQELFNIAETAEKNGNRRRAIKAYRKLVKKYPRSTLAPESSFRSAKLTEGSGDMMRAALTYR